MGSGRAWSGGLNYYGCGRAALPPKDSKGTTGRPPPGHADGGWRAAPAACALGKYHRGRRRDGSSCHCFCAGHLPGTSCIDFSFLFLTPKGLMAVFEICSAELGVTMIADFLRVLEGVANSMRNKAM